MCLYIHIYIEQMESSNSTVALSRVFLTPVEEYPTPPPSPTRQSIANLTIDNAAPEAGAQSLSPSPSIVQRIVDDVRTSLAALDLSSSSLQTPQSPQDEPNRNTVAPIVVCKTFAVSHADDSNDGADAGSTGDHMKICHNQADGTVYAERTLSEMQNDADRAVTTTYSTLSQPNEIVSCVTVANQSDANTDLRSQCFATHVMDVERLPDLVVINGHTISTQALLDALQNPTTSAAFYGTYPVNDDVRADLVHYIQQGYTEFEINEEGDYVAPMDVDSEEEEDDDEVDDGHQAQDEEENGQHTDHMHRLTPASQRAMMAAQKTEHEWLVDAFVEYASYWSMRIGTAMKPYIMFGILRYIRDISPELILHNSTHDAATAAADEQHWHPGTDLDIIKTMADVIPLRRRRNTALEGANTDQPQQQQVDSGALDVLTTLISTTYGMSAVDAQRYTLPWILQSSESALRLPYFPNEQEWNAFVSDYVVLKTRNLVDSIGVLQQRVQQRADFGQDPLLQVVDTALSESSFRHRLMRLHPVLLRAIAFHIPITGPFVTTALSQRPYTISQDELLRGGPFSAPVAEDMAERVASLVPSIADSDVSSDDPDKASAPPRGDKTLTRLDHVFYVTTPINVDSNLPQYIY